MTPWGSAPSWAVSGLAIRAPLSGGLSERDNLPIWPWRKKRYTERSGIGRSQEAAKALGKSQMLLTDH